MYGAAQTTWFAQISVMPTPLTLPANFAWSFMTRYQRSPHEVQIELQHGVESDCCRLWTPGALYYLYNITYNIKAKSCVPLRMILWTINDISGTSTTSEDSQWWLSRPWLRMNWRKETLVFTRESPPQIFFKKIELVFLCVNTEEYKWIFHSYIFDSSNRRLKCS
jgi:hypothetical protein